MINVSHKKSVTLGGVLSKILLYAVLICVVALVVLPFYFMLESSFKTFGEAMGTFTWWPKTFTFEAYGYIFGKNGFHINLLRSLLTTLIITVPSMAVGLFVSTMAAYTFAKRDFDGKNVLFWILLFTMMLPGTIIMMPQYLIYAELNLVGTFIPLMLPGMFGSATCVFFMRQFISGLPSSLIDAAKIDGLNHFKIFLHIIIPLSTPALISQTVLWFLAGYNDYMGPLIYLKSVPVEWKPVQVALAYISSTAGGTTENIPAIMAGSVVSILPPLILYAVFQKFFISGIAVSGLKG